MKNRASPPPAAADPVVPAVSPLWLAWFERYTRWYLRRHFHTLRLDLEGGHPAAGDETIPRVLYLNHAAWWDPLVCLELRRTLLPRHAAFAPIELQAVAKYGFFRRLGFFGVEPGTSRGAARFLRVSEAILSRPLTSLWVTPQARFADVRERPVRLRPGLGHLAARLERSTRVPARVRFLPLAIEYTFWEERLPEVLVRFGQPIEVATGRPERRSAEAWNEELSDALAQTQDHLAQAAQARHPDRFKPLVDGTVGVGGVYDVWRRLRALLRRQSFDPHHGRL